MFSTTTPQKKTRFVTDGAPVEDAGQDSSPTESGMTLRGEELRAIP
jgi:hypothetical protein